MKGKHAVAVLAVAAVLGGGSRIRADDDDDGKEAKARRLVVVSGEAADGSRACREAMDQKASSLPPEFVKRFKAAADPKAFEEIFAPVYANNFTGEELDALIAFYESPIGKKLAKKRMKLQKEAMQAGGAWGAKMSVKIMADLNKAPGQDDDDDEETPAPAPKKEAPKKEAPKPDPKKDEDF